MGKLLGIGHDVDRLDAPIPRLHCEHRLWPPVQIAHDSGLAVDLHDSLKNVERHELSEAVHDRAGDLDGSVDRLRKGGRFATAIRVITPWKRIDRREGCLTRYFPDRSQAARAATRPRMPRAARAQTRAG